MDNTRTPKVSVVVTCYNYAKYLPGCIESVLRQTWQDFEIIVVNDGSKDNTDEVIAPYLDDGRINYIKQENAGQAHAKNTGIRNARGELIAFLDADDLWLPDKLERQIPLFDDPLIGMVYSTCSYIDDSGREIMFSHESPHLAPRAGKVTDFLFIDNFIPFSSSVVRRECLECVGVFNESIRMGIDWDLWLRVSVRYLFGFVDRPLLIYRVGHPGQMSKNLEVRQECTDRIMAKFLEEYPGVVSIETVRDAQVYTYINRGYYYRSRHLVTSLKYYCRALGVRPLHPGAWRGLIVTCIQVLQSINK
jgi:glycosyltransferase involved in cell wall biosynthesis